MSTQEMTWALEEFGGMELGDRRRTRRWLSMAARAAAYPSGRITEVFGRGAERQAAYKLLEKQDGLHAAVVSRASTAAFERAGGRYLVVPQDQCTLTLPAASLANGFGRVGCSEVASGVESMHAIVLSNSGVPLGLGAQVLWTRTGPKRGKTESTRRLPLDQKETRFWLQVMEQTRQAHRQSHCQVPLWFQLDEGADAREVVAHIAELEDCWVTVRVGGDRRVLEPEEAHLYAALAKVPVAGIRSLEVTAAPGRAARKARLEVRFSRVTVHLRRPGNRRGTTAELFAVLVEEGHDTTPVDEKPIRWLLLTNRPVASFDQACEVISAYALRWRVEEVHRSWKTGCRVEWSALDYRTFQAWAALLLCVALRIERLKRLSREQPDIPASGEFTPEELEALTLLSPRARKRTDSDACVTLGEAVLWLAEMGGYTGHSPSRGPPGSIVLQRGLDRLAMAAEVIQIQRSGRK